MQTALMKVAADGHGNPEIYREAVAILRAGGLVAFPSETVYGLGGDAFQAKAVAAIFAAKNRPADNPLIVHVRDGDHARELVEDPYNRLTKLASVFWPGPLTVVLPRRCHVDASVSRGLETLALRVPGHAVALRLIRESGLALAAPSANLSGRPSPTLAKHVFADLNGQIPLILDGGPCEVGIESTVLDISSEKVRILRPGHLDGAALAEALGEPVFEEGVEHLVHRSPGTRYRHYRPDAQVWIVDESLAPQDWPEIQRLLNQKFSSWGYAGSRETLAKGKTEKVRLETNPSLYARGFYAALRNLDQVGVSLILVDGPTMAGSGRALWDRLEKAADVHIKSLADVRDQLAKIPSKP